LDSGNNFNLIAATHFCNIQDLVGSIQARRASRLAWQALILATPRNASFINKRMTSEYRININCIFNKTNKKYFGKTGLSCFLAFLIMRFVAKDGVTRFNAGYVILVLG
jgi:hypothetical protein